MRKGTHHTEEAKEKNKQAHMGIRAWNKGLTKEIDLRVAKYVISGSIKRRGKRNSPKTEFKKGCHASPKTELKKGHYGNKSPAWKGGITFLHDAIRTSYENKQWICNVLKHDNYTCQECDKRGGNLEVHHIKLFSKILQEFLQEYSQFSPIEDKETLQRLSTTYAPFWDLENGIVFCKECHNKTKLGVGLKLGHGSV